MFTALKDFLAFHIRASNAELRNNGYSDIDRKKLMSGNGWSSLPENIQRYLFHRDAFQQVFNFVNGTPNYMVNPGATEFQKLEYLAHDFMDRYEKWLSENHGKYSVNKIISDARAEVNDEVLPLDEALFDSLTLILLHRYGVSLRGDTPDEPDAA
jgi:hypothetical protein